MDILVLQDYIVLVVVGICVCVGYIIKNVIPSTKVNQYIPLIMGVLGLALNIWLNRGQFTPDIILGGLTSGLASTGLHQAVTNLINKFKSE